MKGLSLKFQAAAVYALVFVAAIAWSEIRFRPARYRSSSFVKRGYPCLPG